MSVVRLLKNSRMTHPQIRLDNTLTRARKTLTVRERKKSVDRNQDDKTQSEIRSDYENDNKSDSDQEKSGSCEDADQKSRSSSSASGRSSGSLQGKKEKQQDENPQDFVVVEVVANFSYEERVKRALSGDMDFHYPEDVGSGSDKKSVDRNQDDETQSEIRSDYVNDNESDSDQEESDSCKDVDQKSRSSSSAGGRSSGSLREEKEKQQKDDNPQDVVVTEVVANLSYEERVKRALTGDMDFHYPEKVKIVRIFTSSTFTGTL